MKILISAVLCLLLVGCAGAPTQRLSEDTMSSLNGKSVTLVQRESPSFVAMTAAKGGFALVGAGAAVVAGNNLVKSAQIEDPAYAIRSTLGDEMVKRLGVSVAGHSGAVAGSDKVADIVLAAQDSDYALDVVTNGWSFMYDGFKFSDYFVGYSARLRLIDVATSTVLASGMCAYDAKKAGKAAVSHDTLIADNAAYIKQELADATSSCVQQFNAAVL